MCVNNAPHIRRCGGEASGGGGFNFFFIHNEPKMTLEDAQPKGVKCVEFI